MHVNPKLPKYIFPLFFPSISFLFCQSSIQSIALLIRFIDEAIVMSSTRALKYRTWERTNRRDWLERCNLRTMIGLLMYYWIMSSLQKKWWKFEKVYLCALDLSPSDLKEKLFESLWWLDVFWAMVRLILITMVDSQGSFWETSLRLGDVYPLGLFWRLSL